MIFDIIGNKITITAEALVIPEFKDIWVRDRSESKKIAINQLSYIVFLVNPSKKNPYYNYSEDDRKEMLKKDFSISTIDDKINSAILKYSKLTTSRYKRLVTAALDSSDQLTNYYKNIKFDSDEFDLKEYQDSLTKLSKSVKDLRELEKQLEVDNDDTGSKVQGGNEIGFYELPR